MKRTIISLLMVLILMLSLAGCGASTSQESSGAYDKNMSNGSAVSDSLAESESPNLPADRKLIRTVRMQAETEDLTGVMTQLEQTLTQFGGYLQQKEIYQGSTYRGTQKRSAYLVIRIPAKDLDAFLVQLSGTAHVVSTNESVDDVTLQYIDVDSQLKALRTEEERLLALMEKAESLADLLAIEQRLTQVQQQIQSVTSQLKALDSQIEYATIYLNLDEVVEYTPVEEESTWQKIGTGFMDSLSDIGNGFVDVFVFLVANSPRLLLLGGIAFVVILLIRRSNKRKKEKKNPPAA
jgi:hypothetical protein